MPIDGVAVRRHDGTIDQPKRRDIMTTENMKLSRRGFLGLGAAATAAAAAAGLAGCAPKTMAETGPAEPEGYTWETAPEPITEVDATEETDVVVIGGGIAGFSAACSAAEKGAKVVLLEKTGAGQFRGIDYGAIGGKLQLEAGIDLRDRKQDVLQEVLPLSGREYTDSSVSEYLSERYVSENSTLYGNDFSLAMLAAEVGSCGLYTASTSPLLYEKLPNYETDQQFEEEHFAAMADEINARAFEEEVDEKAGALSLEEDAAAVRTYSVYNIKTEV